MRARHQLATASTSAEREAVLEAACKRVAAGSKKRASRLCERSWQQALANAFRAATTVRERVSAAKLLVLLASTTRQFQPHSDDRAWIIDALALLACCDDGTVGTEQVCAALDRVCFEHTGDLTHCMTTMVTTQQRVRDALVSLLGVAHSVAARQSVLKLLCRCATSTAASACVGAAPALAPPTPSTAFRAESVRDALVDVLRRSRSRKVLHAAMRALFVTGCQSAEGRRTFATASVRDALLPLAARPKVREALALTIVGLVAGNSEGQHEFCTSGTATALELLLEDDAQWRDLSMQHTLAAMAVCSLAGNVASRAVLGTEGLLSKLRFCAAVSGNEAQHFWCSAALQALTAERLGDGAAVVTNLAAVERRAAWPDPEHLRPLCMPVTADVMQVDGTVTSVALPSTRPRPCATAL